MAKFIGDTVAINNLADSLVTGNYVLTVFTNNNCKASAQIYLPEPIPIQIDKVSVSPAFCSNSANGVIEVKELSGGTGILTVEWGTNPIQTGNELNGLKPNIYHFKIKDENACSLADSATVNSTFELELALDTNQTKLANTCFQSYDAAIGVLLNSSFPSNITSQINKPFQFVWSDNAPLASSDSISSFISGLSLDTFNVMVTNPDLPGCLATLTIGTNQPDSLSIKIENSKPPNCKDPFSGSVVLLGAGGTPNYTFTWPNGSTENIKTDLAASNYLITLTDKNGCEKIDNLVIPAPDSVFLEVVNIQHENCAGIADGQIEVNTNQPAAQLNYFWQPNISNTTIADNLGHGIYQIKVENENGCTDSVSIELISQINESKKPIITDDHYEFDFFAPNL